MRTATAFSIPVLKTLGEVLTQYYNAAFEAATWLENGNLTCAGHNVMQYEKFIRKDYADIKQHIDRALDLRAKAQASDSLGYREFLEEQIDGEIFYAEAIAGNPLPNNCGIFFFKGYHKNT
jgi:hypothetical protein